MRIVSRLTTGSDSSQVESQQFAKDCVEVAAEILRLISLCDGEPPRGEIMRGIESSRKTTNQ